VALASSAGALAPYVPRLVAAWHEDAPRHRAVDGTLVSVDISGFTALSERLAEQGRIGAEELIARISTCYAGLIDRSTARGGDVLKFRGDALLLFFDGDDHARRAAAAALDMQAFIDENGRTETSTGPVTLRMAAGLVSGRCDFFLVGSSHRELVVAGPAATAVLELEDEADAGEVLLSAETRGALGIADRLLPRERSIDAPEPPSAPPPAGDLEALVPNPLRPLLLSGAVESEHRLATVAFVKFAGTDGLVAADPGAAAERIAALGRVVGEVTDDLGITWLESDIDVDGGKLYLVAGAPASAGEDEERMLLALRRIVDADVDLGVRGGVNRGHVVAGEIGSEVRRTYAVMGDTTNVAARLTARAEPGQILATGDVLQRSRARFETEGLPFLMKGKARPVTGHRVGALIDRQTRDDAPLPMVDRTDELAALRDALDAARRREFRVVELVGEPGIGKSRLVDELRRHAAGFQQLDVHAEQYASSSPYAAVRPFLRQLVGVRADDDAEAAGAQLLAFVPAVMPELAPWLPLLAIPLGAAVPSTTEVDELDEAFRHERLRLTVDAFLTRILLMPTLLVVEDMHWLDEASLALLRHIVSGSAARPWLVCVTRRDDGEGVGGGAHAVPLEPLGPGDTTTLALAVAGDEPVAESELAQLAERSGGNPLFVRALVAVRPEERSELPETIEKVITARIDRLDAVDRLLLRCASVLGPAFDVDLLGEVLAAEQVETGGADRLARLTEFVAVEDVGRLRFRHDLFRAVGYEGLSYARRRELHARVAEALERRHGEDAAALLSLHFTEAGDPVRAWRYAVLAGDRARSQYANLDAAELYQRALLAAEELEDVEPAEVARVAEGLGDVCEVAARYDDAAHGYRTARAIVSDDPRAQSRLLCKEGVLRERAGSYADAAEHHERGLAILAEHDLDEPRLRASLQVGIAAARYRQGRFVDCVAHGERAVVDAERGDALAELAHAYYLLDVATTQLGRPERRYRELALPIYEEIGDLVGQASVLNNLGIGAYYEGRWDESVAFYRRSGDASTRAGDVVSAAMVRNNEGEVLSDQGRLDEARRLFEDALRVFRAAGHRGGATACAGNLARAEARAGHFEQAHELYERVVGEVEALGAEELILETHARVAECFVLEGRHREAFGRASEVRARAEASAPSAVRALVDRICGYAEAQDRAPERARQHFEAALQLARDHGLEYDTAMTLHALADTKIVPEAAVESRAILDRLGVVSSPRVPLP
jgi:class 3 adenylate cyclase/tetratricopeptide (TPR) repeat protein